MAEFRKKPVVITAIQWTGDNVNAIWDAFGAECIYGPTETNPDWLLIDTLEGRVRASLGDWVIRGVAGEVYPCRSDIFEATYEPVTS